MTRLFIPNFTFEAEAEPGWTAPVSLLQLNCELAWGWRAVAQPGDEILWPTMVKSHVSSPVSGAGEILLRSHHTLAECTATEIIPWGITSAVRELDKRLQLTSHWPEQSAVWAVNSREFGAGVEEQLGCSLPGSRIIHHLKELQDTIRSMSPFQRGWILKANLGQSGRGHLRLRDGSLTDELAQRVTRMLDRQGCCQLEPVLPTERELGVQWDVPHSGPPRLLAVTELITAAGGEYRGTRIGPTGITEELLERVLEVQRRAAVAVRERGYFGPLGIDAMIYRNLNGKPGVRPLQDLNARWTMGRLAWEWSLRRAHEVGSSPGRWLLAKLPPVPDAIAVSPEGGSGNPAEKRLWWVDDN